MESAPEKRDEYFSLNCHGQWGERKLDEIRGNASWFNGFQLTNGLDDESVVLRTRPEDIWIII